MPPKCQVDPLFFTDILPSWKILFPERYFLHGKGLSPQVFQGAGRSGEGEAELIGVEGLLRLMIAPVHLAPAVLSVPQQGAAQLRHGYADLMGPSGEESAFHQGQAAAGLQGLIKSDSGLAAGDGPAIEKDLLFCLVLQQKALDAALRHLGTAHRDAQIALFQLVILGSFG